MEASARWRGGAVMWLAAIALLWWGSVRADDEKARITDLLMAREGSTLLLSFQLLSAFNDQTLERIQSGLPTGFTYHLKMEKLRKWWFDRRVYRSELQVVAMYNAITREYLVNYKQNGELVSSRVVKTVGELESAMTIFHAWPSFELSDPQAGRLVVRLRAELGSRTILAIIPTTVHTDWTESVEFGADSPATEHASSFR